MTNKERFTFATEAADLRDGGIGTLSEKPLHRIIKSYIEPDRILHEVELCGCVVDVFNGEEVFEIQTGGFYPLKKKLERLLPEYKVTVVRPVIAEKRLIWINKESGETTDPKKSPRKERLTDILPELTRLGDLFPHPNLGIKLIFVSADEFKYLDGYGESKKRGATKVMRLPRELISETEISTAEDISAMLPELPSPFRASELQSALRLRGRRGFFVLRLLMRLGVVERVGKEKNTYLYMKR